MLDSNEIAQTMEKMFTRKAFQKVKPYVVMVLLQSGFAGMHLVSTATVKDGMNHFVLAAYRNAVAAAVIAPFAFWLERPVLDQNFYYLGVKLTSASFTAALENINPAVTFLLALVLRVEKVNVQRRGGMAKMLGVLVTLSGALLMILYKGPLLHFPWASTQDQRSATAAVSEEEFMWVKGTLLILGCCFSWSIFLILQSNTLESYPANLTLTTWICFLGVVANSAASTFVYRGNTAAWVVGWDKRLFAPIYSGVVCSGLSYYILGMVMNEKGPVFAGAFSPLSMIITAILGSIILSEKITLGMLAGTIVLLAGLYSLLWGKSKDLSCSTKNEAQEGQNEMVTVVVSGGEPPKQEEV
ncbi:hypothetical protein HPP92_015779 [Vanilla planifolia]|uniref:WAT1-related protein n=1 Tax=Vanilla planifolia TaxID=51239 RepID=A0A835URG6_VANPL|nr:hypothetical protein HPP92_015779 [Vanilla planifolia]